MQERCARVATLERRPPALAAALSELRQLGPSRAEELEVSCWVELGALLDRSAELNAARPAEAEHETPRLRWELLSLLPHAMPQSLGAGAQWPDSFTPLRMMRMLPTDEDAARVDVAYPAWRRSTRLSFALADVLNQLGYTMNGKVAVVLQELLEAASTTDRLRLVLRRMREARHGL